MKKSIQISIELFVKLYMYHCMEIRNSEFDGIEEFIKSELEMKNLRILEHNKFTQKHIEFNKNNSLL